MSQREGGVGDLLPALFVLQHSGSSACIGGAITLMIFFVIFDAMFSCLWSSSIESPSRSRSTETARALGIIKKERDEDFKEKNNI